MKIIPVPKKIEAVEGVCDLGNAGICIADGSDIRLTAHAVTLKREIEAAGAATVMLKNTACCCKKSGGILITHESGTDESYILTVTENGIKIVGASAAGAFYGIQTLRQLVKEYGIKIPCITITDKPDFKERGFYHDITRGRVPTLAQLKKIADELAYFKINELQLYVEDAFDFVEFEGIVTKDDVLTAEEVRELDEYCYNNFIELVPSLSTFGHLYNLLQSDKYKHLCELPDYKPTQIYWIEKMAHHTIDVSNEESIELVGSLIDQYVPLFRSNKFNICCDETFDLCRGRNSGKDNGEEYFKFIEKIIERVKRHGKTVQMWGDIVLNHQEKMDKLPEGTVMLNWCYEQNPNEENVKTFGKSGLPQVVCPGTSSWNRFVEEIDRSFGNISGMAKFGYENGAIGLVNTNWGDFGNLCTWNAEQYGMVLGAERSWNPVGEIGRDFEMAASFLLYDTTDTNMVTLITEMGRAERTCDWCQFVYWYSANKVEGRTTTLEVDVDKAIANIAKCDDIIESLGKAAKQGDVRFTDLILAARAIRLMNREVLMINRIDGFSDRDSLRADFAAWMDEYRTAWLRDNKKSQIELIAAFIKDIVEI